MGGVRAMLVPTVAAALLLAGCGSPSQTATPPASPTASPSPYPKPQPPAATSSPQSRTQPAPAPPKEPTQAPAPQPPAPQPPATQPPATQAPAAIPPGFAGRIVTALPTSRPVVALTFDGGANADGVPAILATLRSTGVRATFFPTGEFARRYPDAVAQFAAAGHVVGNHSNTHPDFTGLSASAQLAEIAAAEASISALSGRSTSPWFRFPFGASDTAAIEAVNGAGYACIGWTVDTLGWKGTSGGQSADSVVQRVLATARPGQIVLMHVGSNPEDGSTLDADALPAMINELRRAGYEFVALGQ